MTTHDFAAGDVLLIGRQIGDAEPGTYVVLAMDDAAALLVQAGEDEWGDLVPTGRGSCRVNVYDLAAVGARRVCRVELPA